MQAYVLQQTISGFDGYNATIINYQKTHAGKPIIGKTVFCKPLKSWTPKRILSWTTRILAHPIRMRKYEKFFKKFYFNYSSTPLQKCDLENIQHNYDVFVVGSDQVWNMRSPNVDTTHFLDFVNESKKKVSYAASLGSAKIPEVFHSTLKDLISDFSAISVRERESVKTVFDLTGKEAKWVLDPSLLWNKEQYECLVGNKKNYKYVFLYLRESSPKLEKFAHNLAKAHGLKVVKVSRHWKCNKKGKERFAVGPHEWLAYMKNAEYIVTNSFHGICFSITFEKEFFVDLLKGGASHTNTRMESLLEQFNLKTRGIDSVTDLSDIKKIDYAEVAKIKEERKQYSLNYLKEALDRSTAINE